MALEYVLMLRVLFGDKSAGSTEEKQLDTQFLLEGIIL